MNLVTRFNQDTLRDSISWQDKNRGILPQLRISWLRLAINILPCFFLDESQFIRSNSDNGTIALMEFSDLERQTSYGQVI